MVTCGMYDAAGDWVSAVGMPAKSGVGGGIVAVLPGQLGIGVYSPLLDAKGNSVRGVRLCRSLSEQLGLHFLTVSRDSRATLRAVYEPRDNIRVYETHGDLLFCGAEQVVRTVDRDCDDFEVAILDVSRVDDIDDAAKALLSGMSTALHAAARPASSSIPDGLVIREDSEFESVRYSTVEDAVDAACERSSAGNAQTGRPAGSAHPARAGFTVSPNDQWARSVSPALARVSDEATRWPGTVLAQLAQPGGLVDRFADHGVLEAFLGPDIARHRLAGRHPDAGFAFGHLIADPPRHRAAGRQRFLLGVVQAVSARRTPPVRHRPRTC